MLKIRKKLAEKKEASKGIAKAGFTLIELLVVLAILAILVLLAAPRFVGYTKDANVAAMQADAKVLANSALIYHVESDDASWPTDGTAAVVDITDAKDNAVEVLDTEGAEAEVKVEALSEDVLRKDHVQSLKGKFSDYGLVTETVKIGDDTLQAGDIVHRTGVEDKDGNTHFGVNIEVEDPVTP